MQQTSEKLTSKRAAKAEPTGKRYFIFDSTVNGFGMVVQPSGTKAFIFQYRDRAGQKRRLKIGDYGPLTVDQARNIAIKFYADVREGKDPRQVTKFEQGFTVNDLLDAYLQSAKFAGLAEKTSVCDKQTIANHLRPLIGKIQVADLSPDDLERMVLDVTRGKTSRTVKTKPRGKSMVKGGPGAAQTCLRKIKAILSWGLKEKLISNHPGMLVKAGQNGRREVYLEADGYTAVFRAMDEMERDGTLRPSVADAIRLIALTGARRDEIRALVWRQVDLKNNVIELKRGEHKGGHKGGSVKTIMLSPQACEIINRQPRRGQNDRVFKASRGEGSTMASINKPWTAIRKRAGVSNKVVIHSLRHSLASYMANNNQDALAIKAVLGHKQISTSMIYIHLSKNTHQKHAEVAASGISGFMKHNDDGKQQGE